MSTTLRLDQCNEHLQPEFPQHLQRDAAAFDSLALIARVGLPPGENAGAGQVDLVRWQLCQCPRGCSPCDEGLLAAARDLAQAPPRPQGQAMQPPRLDLTAIARGGRGWCGSERAAYCGGGGAPSRVRAREEELVRLLRAVMARASSPAQLVKDLIACKSDSDKGPPGLGRIKA
jgi:hypothetical protein